MSTKIAEGNLLLEAFMKEKGWTYESPLQFHSSFDWQMRAYKHFRLMFPFHKVLKAYQEKLLEANVLEAFNALVEIAEYWRKHQVRV